MNRPAFTLVETIVAFAVMALLAALVHGFYVSAAQGTSMSVEASDALKSVSTAVEVLRTDLGGMTFQRLADLSITKDGRGFAVSVPKGLEPDLFKADWQVVRYALEAVPKSEGAHRLIRSVDDARTPLASVLLKDLRVRFVPPKGVRVPAEPVYAQEGVSPFQAYLEITLVGMGAPAGKQTYTASILHPLSATAKPAPYTLLVNEP